jgi:hypothetical protein
MSSPSDFQKQPNQPPIEAFQKNPGNPNASQPVAGYQPPALGDLSKPGGGQLGSLAQSARDKQLGHAKGWLIFLGIMTILVNLFMVANLPNEVQQEMRSIGPNARDAETAMYLAGYVIYGGTVLLGVIFIVLGCLVRTYPLPITVASMLLFIGAQIIFGLLNPMNILGGIIFKIIIFVVLLKAIGAASAYEKERRKNLSWETA